MNYKEAIDYLYENMPMFHRIGAAAFKPDLSNSIALAAHLDYPQNSFKSIHIAGTNGKGSTAHLLSAVLQAAGYKVGLYTSPHYLDFRERIKVNGAYISEAEVINFTEGIQDFVKAYQPSFFELTVGMAFDHFRRQEVDVAVVEVGLGGRLDATNIIFPECSVITNIDFDHEQFLGNTLAAIAGEKAGIIKPNTPVVIGEEREETRAVFIEKAQINNAKISFASKQYEALLIQDSIEKQVFDIYQNGAEYLSNFEVALTGSYQVNNIKTVLATIAQLNDLGFNIPETAVRTGFSNVRTLTKIIGRWDVLQKEKPVIICDSAHNPHGLRYVSEALQKMPCNKLHIVFGMVSDKSPEKLLSVMPKKAAYYFCKADMPRALASEKLLEAAKNMGLAGNAFHSVAEAYEAAKARAEADDIIFVGGSIFVLGEIL